MNAGVAAVSVQEALAAAAATLPSTTRQAVRRREIRREKSNAKLAAGPSMAAEEVQAAAEQADNAPAALA